MTQPEIPGQGMTRPVVVGIEEMLSQARRLGLLQVYRPASVFQTPDDLTQVQVILDGDTAPIRAQSLVGIVLTNMRVMVMTVPPQGVYIIGFVGIDASVNLMPTTTYITTTGADTFDQVPGAVYYEVECVGAGGAGGGAANAAAGAHSKGSGGGGGGYAKMRIPYWDLSFPVSTTVGAGGTGVSGAAGNSGGTTDFEGVVVATGGTGGTTSASNTAAGLGVQGGAGGAGTQGDLLLAGGAGTHGMGSAALCAGGNGGSSFMGGGAAGRATGSGTTSLAGLAGGNFGGGGGGATSNGGGGAQAGGNGANGLIIITAYYH